MSEQAHSAMTGATTAELIAAVLTAPDEDDDAWQPALQELQARPTRETFDAATALLASDAMPKRELGVEILGGLGEPSGDPSRPFREQTVVLLLDLLAHEHEPASLSRSPTRFVTSTSRVASSRWRRSPITRRTASASPSSMGCSAMKTSARSAR